MAATAWSLVLATLTLVWWLAGSTRGLPLPVNQHQNLQWMQQSPDDLMVAESDSRQPPLDEIKRFPRSDPWGQTLQRLRASGITPAMLKQLLREANRWPLKERTTKEGQPEVTNNDVGMDDVSQWKAALSNSLQRGNKKRWLDLFGGSSVETRFPLPERRQFPEVDWRGFNEDVFHESFGDFNPMKRWKRGSSEV